MTEPVSVAYWDYYIRGDSTPPVQIVGDAGLTQQYDVSEDFHPPAKWSSRLLSVLGATDSPEWVLDIGGIGKYSPYFADAEMEVMSTNELCAQVSSERGVDTTLVSDYLQLPVESSMYDLILVDSFVFPGALDEDEIDAFFAELSRLLRRDGKVLLQYIRGEEGSVEFDFSYGSITDTQTITVFTDEEFVSFVDERGWEIERIASDGRKVYALLTESVSV